MGVGQSEVDIVNVADVVLMVLNPESGDEIQIFKAGIIEIADIFVINKADLGGSDNKISEIRNYFAMAAKPPRSLPPRSRKTRASASCWTASGRFQQQESCRIGEKRAAVKRNFVEKIVAERWREEMRLDAGVEELLAGAAAANPFLLAEDDRTGN